MTGPITPHHTLLVKRLKSSFSKRNPENIFDLVENPQVQTDNTYHIFSECVKGIIRENNTIKRLKFKNPVYFLSVTLYTHFDMSQSTVDEVSVDGFYIISLRLLGVHRKSIISSQSSSKFFAK